MADTSRIHVASGVIVTAGRVLLTQRDPLRSDYGMLWECPGGKVEGSETPEEALARELREEVDLDAIVGAELAHFDFEAAQLASGRAARVTFFAVDRYAGHPAPKVSVGLGWFGPEELWALPLVPANHLYRARLANLLRGAA